MAGLWMAYFSFSSEFAQAVKHDVSNRTASKTLYWTPLYKTIKYVIGWHKVALARRILQRSG